MSESEVHPGKPVRDPASYRVALQAWMRGQRPSAQALEVVEVDMPQATGFSNETVFFSTRWREEGRDCKQRYVARIEPEGGGLFPVQTPACRTSVALQHRIMQAVATSGAVPVPPLLPLEEDASVLGSPFFVMEFVPGRIPADVPRYSQQGFLAEEASPEERGRMVSHGIELLAALSRLDWRELGLDWLDRSGSGEPEFSRQVSLYREDALRVLAGREHPVLLGALDWLDANVPAAKPGLSWGDARLGNMIWQDYRCAAVVDWEAAAVAPPEADIGWWVMFDRMSFDDMDTPRLPGFPTRDEMIAQWESQSGRRVKADIHYWEIFAVMRFCAIMIGLGDRFERAGLSPPGQSPAIQNGVTDALERLLAG